MQSLMAPTLLLLAPAMAAAMTVAATGKATPLVPRVVPSPLPTVYVYDHCPFCVRVRLALGVKNVKHEVRFMANDDVETPTKLIGKKLAPIWVNGDEAPMPESLDIIAKIDSDPAFGTPGLIKPASGRTDLKAWQKEVQKPMRLTQRPRYVMSPLPEFMQADARRAFIKNHFVPIGDLDKPSWKELSEEEHDKFYAEAISMSDACIAELNAALLKLEDMIHCPQCVSEGGVSYDDIDTWSRLRSLTIIKGLNFPPKVRAYLDYFAEVGDVPLYDAMAC